MKFFVPNMTTPEGIEHTYKAIKLSARETVGLNSTNRKIFKIGYTHHNKYHEAEVGKVTDANDEMVIAVLEVHAYLVCTRNRGVVEGMPILVNMEETTSVEDFE
jgi:hypothetical protein